MTKRLNLTDEERRERRQQQNRASYQRHAKERIAQVVERRRERKRENPNYVPKGERVTPPEIEEERRLRKLAANKRYYERNREKIDRQNLERRWANGVQPRGPKASDAELAERNRARCRVYRSNHHDELNAKSREWHLENRDAQNARRKVHYHEHKEDTLPVAREKRQQSRLTSPVKHLLKGAKERAKKRALPYDLTEEYLSGLWTGKCAVSALQFSVGQRGFGPKFLSPSLDRIVPALGYTKGNVRIVLWGVNAFKYDGSDEDMYRVAVAIVRNFRPNASPSR